MAFSRLDELHFRLSLVAIGCDALGDAHSNLHLRLAEAQKEHAILYNVRPSLLAKAWTSNPVHEGHAYVRRAEELEDEIGRIAEILSELGQIKKPI